MNRQAPEFSGLLSLRAEAQDRAIENDLPGRFQTVIPLPFVPDDSELGHLPGPTGLDDLRMLAVCRLMLDNFAHVKCSKRTTFSLNSKIFLTITPAYSISKIFDCSYFLSIYFIKNTVT